jgi:hypothetical protein
MMSRWRRVTRTHRCPICDHPDWCRLTEDGDWALCRRVDTGGGIHRVDKVGMSYWLYPMMDTRPERPVIELPVRHSPERASPDVLHRVYHAWLDRLSLTQIHYNNLRSRGLADAEITRRQYRTMPQHGRADLARRLVERYGADVCSRVPALYLKTEGGRRWWSLAGSPGLLIPVRDQGGRIMALMVRRDEADADPKYMFASSARHGGPGPMVGVHVPRHDGAHGFTVRLTEGVLKADVATSLDGMLTLGLSAGVASWRQALPVLQAMQVNRVYVAFDADVSRNIHVARALQQCVRTLQASGLQVRIEVWSEVDGKGIDDVMAGGHQPERLGGQAMREAIRAAVRSALRLDPAQIRQRLAQRQQAYRGRLRLPAEGVL